MIDRDMSEAEIATAMMIVLMAMQDALMAGSASWSNFETQIASAIEEPLAKAYRASAIDLAKRHKVKTPEDYGKDFQEWAKKRAREVARDMRISTKQRVKAARERSTPDTFEDESRGIFNSSRAETVGATETTGAISHGEKDAAAEIEDEKQVLMVPYWQTENDSKVCPICRPLHGKPEKDWPEALRDGPPAHPNCLLPSEKVQSLGKFTAGAKSFYVGRCIEFCFDCGSRISVTENHPILTPWGWMRAKFLDKGMQVVHCTDVDRVSSCIQPDNDNGPVVIEKVFDSLMESIGMTPHRVPVASEDLHGDGGSIDGDIDVVLPDGLLQSDADTDVSQLVRQPQLCGNNTNQFALPSDSRLNQTFIGDNTPSGGIMAGGKHGIPSGDVCGCPPESHRIRSRPRGNASSHQSLAQVTSRDTSLARQFILRFSSLVAIQQITKIRQFKYSGHVFDLQCSPYELYTDNGVIVKNCRCTKKWEEIEQ